MTGTNNYDDINNNNTHTQHSTATVARYTVITIIIFHQKKSAAMNSGMLFQSPWAEPRQ
jgi:hypothetical protein